MAAAILTIRLAGRSGRVYSVQGYASDASAVAVKFDETKVPVAGSPDSYTCKEPCTLFDVAFTTDLATPTAVQITRNGSPTGDIVDVTAQLVSVVSRPNPSIPFAQGDKIGLMQIA